MASAPTAAPETAKAAVPVTDKRYKMLEATMKRHQYQPDAVIEVLHNAQELFGYLSKDLLMFVAKGLKLPPSRVYGVTTFYHFFSLEPKGEHTCVVCMGTACYVKGANKILQTLEKELNVAAGGTTADNKISVLTARCIGACGIAPAIVMDGTVTANQTSASVMEQVKVWQKS